MTHETIFLPVTYRGKINNGGQKPSLTTYILDNYDEIDPKRRRPLVLLCPGGGYEHCSVREAEAVAIQMNALGLHAAVLHYSLAPMDFPAALCDAAEAVRCVRRHADEWHVDATRITVGGFSAGGHLAAALGCYWNQPLLQKFLPYRPAEIKPDALLLCYPVITADGQFCHEGSVQNVLGAQRDYGRADISLELHVTRDVPPAFIWHTTADEAVPAENSLLFATALKKAGVPFELHLFEKGRHGLSLATEETAGNNSKWVDRNAAEWVHLFANWEKMQRAR